MASRTVSRIREGRLLKVNTDSQLPEGLYAVGGFVTTHWTAVLNAAQLADPGASEALEAICRIYWMPLYLYVRRRGYVREDAQDMTQGFFARLLEKNGLDAVSRDKGRFRSFMLAALNNFLANEWDRRNAQKRGGGQIHVSIDEERAEERFHHEPATDESPDRFFDRQWAVTVLERAMDRLQQEMEAAGKGGQYRELRDFMTARAGQAAYLELAEKLGTTPAALSMTVSRMRQRYRELIRAEVADTLADPADCEQEIRHLLDALA